MPLYTCPGCKRLISESQPLDHCLQCEAMNERQRARNRLRSGSVSEGRTDSASQCTIITIILRRPSQQYGDTSTTQRPSGSPPAYEEVFQWEAEANAASTRAPNGTGANVFGGATVTLPINIKRA